MSNVLCIYHADCADGLGAAWAVHRALGTDVEFLAAKYGDAPPAAENRDVLIVDFSYPLAELREIAKRARSVLVLDHHKTAQKDLDDIDPPFHDDWLGWLRYIDENTGEFPGSYHNLGAVFDMKKSGAGITWDYLTGYETRPHVIDLIEDRDLWRFRHGDETQEFHAMLSSYDNTDLPAALGRLDRWRIGAEEARKEHPVLANANEWLMLLAEGSAILRYERVLVAGIVHGTRRTMRIADAMVPVACVPGQLASEAGNLMCQDVAAMMIFHAGWRSRDVYFTTTYYDGADGKRHFSLRSPEGGADVGAIAELYGGGGHEHSAGFDRPIGWEGE